MHLLDVFKPKRRSPTQPYSGESVAAESALDMHEVISTWDHWSKSPYSVLDGMYSSSSQQVDTIPSEYNSRPVRHIRLPVAHL